MFRYGDTQSYRLRYISYVLDYEPVRQWWNVTLSFEWAEEMVLPNDFTNPSVLMIISPGGQLLDSVVLDEDGLDSEFVLEDGEKEELLLQILNEMKAWKHPTAKEA